MKINDIQITDQRTVPLTTVTSEMAAYFIDQFRYKYNRRMKTRPMEDMRRAMELGSFPITDGYFCTSLDTGRCDMIDMHRRCSVASTHGLSFKANLHYLTVATEEEKKALWWTIDGDDRDLADFFTALGADQMGLTCDNLNKLSHACGYLENGFSAEFLANHRKVRLHISERLAIAEEVLPHAAAYFTSIKKRTPDLKSVLQSGFAIALGSALCQACPRMAMPFFEAIARNNGLSEGDPRHSYRAEIAHRDRLLKEPLEHAQRLAYFWNSYYDGQSRERCNRLGSGIVVPLKGTNYQIGG